MEEVEDPSMIEICNQECKRDWKAGGNMILGHKADINTDTDMDTATDADPGTKTEAGRDTEGNTDT